MISNIPDRAPAAPVRATKWIAMSVGICVCIYFSLLVLTDLDGAKNALISLPLIIWPLLILVSLLASSIRFMRWHLLLKYQGFNVPVKHNFLSYFSGFALITTPGNIGENIRAIFLKQYNVCLLYTSPSPRDS